MAGQLTSLTQSRQDRKGHFRFFFALFAPWREKKGSRKAAKTAKVISGSSLRPLRLGVRRKAHAKPPRPQGSFPVLLCALCAFA
jgi:hypothetical protein